MKRTPSPTTAAGRDYPTRYCPYCGDDIPKFSEKTNNQHWHSKYKIKKTCHNEQCKALAHASNRPEEKIEVPNDVINRFILGR